ncbi:hypothetical protein HG536_0E02670 [Torulaspora globosa]|uniref:Uncharacterized protein n=1 Tax=Torulaspora globosa TaxID=48254 RepID=A0A7G3ZIM0_9SACH|nr:uncharacterized protein HG536_0E02670 [Torulaspora globosa]QLL33356.1 hypothetical protein HG536_0E02670 [Torulaspora globosa]
MPKNDEVSRGLTLSIQKLQAALKSYEAGEISQEKVARLKELQGALSSGIQEISELVKSEPISGAPALADKQQDSRPSFSRKRFYSSDSPYLNRMDLSRSYRLVPPMKVRKATASPQPKRVSPSEFLLSSLQLLENITNLQRLEKKTSTRDGHSKGSLAAKATVSQLDQSAET